MNDNLKIMSINKGNSKIHNRIDQLNDMINQHKPDIFIINELNVYKSDQITKFQFPGYYLETDNLKLTDTRSRTGVLVKENLTYKRRKDLESNGNSTIWIQVKTK